MSWLERDTFTPTPNTHTLVLMKDDLDAAVLTTLLGKDCRAKAVKLWRE